MSQCDEGFPPRTACLQWCQHRNYDLHVLDDRVEMDLDWWNGHLDRAGHHLLVRRRKLDGEIFEYGAPTVQRTELWVGTGGAGTPSDFRRLSPAQQRSLLVLP